MALKTVTMRFASICLPRANTECVFWEITRSLLGDEALKKAGSWRSWRQAVMVACTIRPDRSICLS